MDTFSELNIKQKMGRIRKKEKKILLLGGSPQQIIAITTANSLGLSTVLCDYTPDNPGQHYADSFYLVSTTDKEAILDVAKREKIDYILSYASDPAAPTAAYVAEKLKLPGNPYKTVKIMTDKGLFRDFLQDNGFNAPKSRIVTSVEDIHAADIEYPFLVKPTDSSGSKGVTLLRKKDDYTVEKALEHAMSFSRNGRVIIEEYIENVYSFVIGGDIFVENGLVTLWGLIACYRDQDVNPLVPVGNSYPLVISDEEMKLVKKTLQEMVTKLGYKNGFINIELMLDDNNRCWIVDIGPRNAGNMIPELLSKIFHCNTIEMTINSARNIKSRISANYGSGYYGLHVIHSNKSGKFKNVSIDEDIKKYIIRKMIFKSENDEVCCFDNAADAIGILLLEFDSEKCLNNIMDTINNKVKVKLL